MASRKPKSAVKQPPKALAHTLPASGRCVFDGGCGERPQAGGTATFYNSGGTQLAQAKITVCGGHLVQVTAEGVTASAGIEDADPARTEVVLAP